MRLRSAIASRARCSSTTVPRAGERGGDEAALLRGVRVHHCHRAYREPEPRLFSFNNPYGACPRCQGFGNTIDFDPEPDHSRQDARRSTEGAIDPWTTAEVSPAPGEMMRAAKAANIPTECAVVRPDAGAADASSKRATAAIRAFRASSGRSNARSTSCMCASCSRSIAATRAARTAEVSGCAPRLAPC